MLSQRRKAPVRMAEESNSQTKSPSESRPTESAAPHTELVDTDLPVTSESIRDSCKRRRAKKTWIILLSIALAIGTIVVVVVSTNPKNGDTSASYRQETPQDPGPKNQVYHPFDRAIRVACAGDSLTLGEIGTLSGESYPSQLQHLLGDDFVTHNYGVNSVTAIRGLKKSYNITQAFQDSIALDADIYLLMLGTNDAKVWARSGQEFGGDMGCILNEATRRVVDASSPAPRIILAIPPWVKGDYGGIKNNVIVNHVQPAIRQFAAAKQLQLVDMYEVTFNHHDYYTADRLHLNVKGYASLAQAWKTAIECNHNDVCETGENCITCPQDCRLNCK